jgi:putative transposase
MPVHTAWYKGSIERFFRSHNDQLLRKLPGYVPIEFSRWEEYNPIKHACISLSSFLKIFHIWLVDVYSQNSHKGKIKGIPKRRWDQDWYDRGNVLPLYHSAEELNKILMPVETRALQRVGIEWDSLTYVSDQLAYLRDYHTPRSSSIINTDGKNESPKVQFKYDIEDVSKIYVPHPEQPGNWIEFRAYDPEGYTIGLSRDKHKIIKDQANREAEKPDIYALARAKQRIEDVMAEEFVLTKKTTARSKIGRYHGLNSNNPNASLSSSDISEDTRVEDSQVDSQTAEAIFTPDMSDDDDFDFNLDTYQVAYAKKDLTQDDPENNDYNGN